MGYFGRIAKQSGLRVKGGQTTARSKARQLSAQTDETSGPLDREEIVMVSNQTTTAAVTKPNSPVVVGEKNPAHDAPTRIPPDSSKTIEKPPRKGTRQTVMDSPKQTEPTRSDARIEKVDAAMQAEREVMARQASEVRLPLIPPENVETGVNTEPVNSQEPETAPPFVKHSDQEAPKNYFEETSEILAGRNAEPAEVQTILLREIQEWIAAGPAPAVDPVTREILPNDESFQVFEKREKEDPLPGVIRIGEAPRERQSEKVPPPNSAIEEQSFELSIGSISVTIEGDSPPRPLTEIKRSEPNSREIKSENRPKGSRLSRHYL